MTQFIVMTAAQAVDVAGYSTPSAQLRPVMLADGISFILGLEVLDDPAHAAVRDTLLTYTQREVAAEEFVQSEMI
jgi:hypothetical protein